MLDQKLEVTQKKVRLKSKVVDLPSIPEKLYFSIGEASRLCGVKPYVLRYWEQEFPQISPSKRRYNRRYYQREDILLLRQIRHLLYEKGFTIEGARAELISLASGEKKQAVLESIDNGRSYGFSDGEKEVFKDVVRELEIILLDLEETEMA
jgi:DNA-binding transcriptional MerR regulator